LKVEYEILKHVADTTRRKKPGAPLVFEAPVEQRGTAGRGAAKDIPQSGNVRGDRWSRRGPMGRTSRRPGQRAR